MRKDELCLQAIGIFFINYVFILIYSMDIFKKLFKND